MSGVYAISRDVSLQDSLLYTILISISFYALCELERSAGWEILCENLEKDKDTCERDNFDSRCGHAFRSLISGVGRRSKS